jgi:Xaa-Pro aminopeptidase
MHTMHSTLLVGLYDWEPGSISREAFDARIAALWRELPADIAGVAVSGDRRSNAELVYLTNFIPKMGDALALIPRGGEPRLYVAGAANMMPPAARQTWIRKLEPLSEPGKLLAQWKSDLRGYMVMLGGENLRLALKSSVDEVLGGDAASRRAAAALQRLMRVKGADELAAVRRACAMLGAMSQALVQAHKAGRGVTDAVTEAEHAGHRMGAQDVRSLVSLDGGRTLRPFYTPVHEAVEPLQVYFAVRYAGYWAEGHVSLSGTPGAAAAQAREALRGLIEAVRPGAKCAELARKARDALKPSAGHPVTAGSAGHGIGVSLEEEPRLTAASAEVLAAGDVLSLRAGVSGDAGHAIVSAMVAVTAEGNEVLWSAPDSPSRNSPE